MKESDWKIFRKRVPEWRERYLQITNKQIISVLSDNNKTPTEQFWDAKKKMEEEADTLVDCLDGHSRSKMHMYLLIMYRHGLVNNDDLEEFSKELREQTLEGAKIFPPIRKN
jgi:protein-tyrosine phosphatase